MWPYYAMISRLYHHPYASLLASMSHLLGNLFILSAPSGAGKSSLIKALLEKHQAAAYPMQVSVSHTTRAPRPGEDDGQHYHFVSREEFEILIEKGVFFEWAEVFGNYYGTSRETIEASMARGIDVFLDIDWQGARQVKQQVPEAKGIFILPPSIEVLRERLHGRGQDSEEVIEGRMQKAVSEMSHCDEFDYILVNDDFDTALDDLFSIVKATRQQSSNQLHRHTMLMDQLLGR